MRVLVVEDSVRLSEILERGLRDADHSVTVRRTGPDGLLAASTEVFDVVVLDWMLPGQDGPEVCAAMRARGIRTPVLMLTAKNDLRDRITGLDAGADDYLAKPFAFDELLARLRALSRRVAPDAVVTVGDLTIDRGRRLVTRAGVEVLLTAREFDILSLLAERPGHVVSRFDILEAVWDGDTDLRSNAIDVHLSTLRAKVDKPFDRTSIRTVRGAGYVLSDEPT